MKKQIVFLFLLFTISSFGQKTSLDFGVKGVIFGDGDYSGFGYENTFNVYLNKHIDCNVGVLFINASELSEEYYYHRHNIFNLVNTYNLKIKPIKTEFIKVFLDGGFALRYRTEILFKESYTVYSGSEIKERIIVNDYNKAFDYGYNINLAIMFKIHKKIHLGIDLNNFGFNAGSGYYSYGLNLNYTL